MVTQFSSFREQEGTIPKVNLLTKAAKQASKTRAVSQESTLPLILPLGNDI